MWFQLRLLKNEGSVETGILKKKKFFLTNVYDFEYQIYQNNASFSNVSYYIANKL